MIDGGPSPASAASPRHTASRPAARRKQALDGLRQLRQLHRLVELHAILPGASRNVSVDMSPVRMMTGIAVLVFSRSSAATAARSSRSAGCSRQAPGRAGRCPRATRSSAVGPVGRRHRAMALVRQEQLQQLAHLGIVLDDQDRAGAMAGAPRSVASLGGRLCRGAWLRLHWRAHLTSMAKTEPLPGRERTRTRWPSRFARRCTMDRPRPRPRLRSRAALSS